MRRASILFASLVLGAYGCHGCNDAPHVEVVPDASAPPDASDVSVPEDAADTAPPYDSGLLHASGPLTFRLKSGNEPPDNRPNAWAYVPTRFDPRKPLHVVVLFHGFRNCIYSYTALGGRPCEPQGPKRTGYDLVNQTEKGESGAIIVVPEIAFNGPSSDPIKLGYKGALRAFLEELLDVALAPYIGEHRSHDIERLALGASSGGYQAMLPALEYGGMKVTDLYFFDALYVQPIKGSALGDFLWKDVQDFDPAKPIPRRFGVIYTDNGGATTQSVATMDAVKPWLADAGHEDWGGFEKRDAEPTVADLKPPIAIVFSGSEHDKIMHRDFWTVMKASGL